MSKLHGTYLIEFKDGDKIVFGNNYKPWWQHATEFIYGNYGNREFGWRYKDVADAVKNVQFSNQQFYDDGGLKWCDIESYQWVIDEVCGKDKLAPAKLSDIIFEESPADKAVLTKKLKEY